MKYYLAGRYDRREELKGYADELRALGHTVTSRWLLYGTHVLASDSKYYLDDGVPLAMSFFAQEDYEDIKASDALVFFSEPLFFSEPPDTASKRGGRHVEFGMALAWGKRLVIIGPRENVFHCLPQVERYRTWQEFLQNERSAR